MENWRDELPDDLKTSTNLAKYETLEAALRGGDEAAGRLGRSITIPSEEAGEDAWTDYREKLIKTAPNLTLHPEHADEEHSKDFWRIAGVPEDAKGYTLPDEYEGLPAEHVENLRGVAESAGWTKKQFLKTVEALTGDYKSQQQTFNEGKAADVAVVDIKFGLAKEQKLATIKEFASQFADHDHPPAWLDDPSLLSSGDILMLDNIVAQYTGKGPQAFTQPIGGDSMTPDEIKQKLTDIRTRMLNEAHTMPRPEYQRLTKKLVTLGQLLVEAP